MKTDIRIQGAPELEYYRYHLRRFMPTISQAIFPGRDISEAGIDAYCLRLISEQGLIVVGAFVDQTMRAAAEIHFHDLKPAPIILTVEEGFRGRGLGGAVLSTALKLARDRGTPTALLYVPGENVALQKLALHFDGKPSGCDTYVIPLAPESIFTDTAKRRAS